MKNINELIKEANKDEIEEIEKIVFSFWSYVRMDVENKLGIKSIEESVINKKLDECKENIKELNIFLRKYKLDEVEIGEEEKKLKEFFIEIIKELFEGRRIVRK